MTSSLGARGLAMFANLQTRPQCHIIDKKDHAETIQSAGMSQFVFAKNCENLKLEINGKVGKVTVECVNNAHVLVNGKVIGGTLEIIRSSQVTVQLGNEAQIPIIQVDNSSHVTINVSTKEQLQSVYYVRTHNIRLVLSDDTTGDLEYDFSPDNEIESQTQRVGEWSDTSPQGHFVTRVSSIQEGFDKSMVRPKTDQGHEVTVIKPDNDAVTSTVSQTDKQLDDVD